MPRNANKIIDLKRLHESFLFDFDKGSITRISNNSIAGHTGKDGYTRVYLDGKLYFRHRLMWSAYYNCQPPEAIDHIDRNPSNDSILNLRAATASKNQQNRKINSNNKSGYTGVCKFKGKWKSTIYIDSKPVYLGLFDTAHDAHKAYLEKKLLIHGKEWSGE